MPRFWSDLFAWSTFGLGAVAAVLPTPEAWETRDRAERVTAVVEISAPRATEWSQVLLAGYSPDTKRFAAADQGVAPTAELRRITGARVNLRGGPSTSFERVGSVRANDVVRLTGVRDGAWVEVQQEGALAPVWIHGTFLGAL